MHRASALLAAALVTGLAAPAAGQAAGTVEIAALGVWHNKTTTMDGLRAYGAGARLGIWLPLGFELEGQLDVTSSRNSAVDNRFRIMHTAASVLYNVPAGPSSLYLRAGYGILSPQGCVRGQASCPKHGAATIAAGFRIPVAATLQIRAEAMYRARPTYDYRSFGAGVGVAWLRARPAAPSGVDTDRDGVDDRRDRCADSPLGALVDRRGCPTDSDSDGVPDGIDRCPGTPAGAAVDRIGCVPRPPD